MHWVDRWRVTVVMENPLLSSPERRMRTRKRRQRTVDTPERAQRVVEWARGHPYVVVCHVEQVRDLIGEPPGVCGCGARYVTAGTMGGLGWLACVCGGHFLFRCRACGLTVVEPVLSSDCASPAR